MLELLRKENDVVTGYRLASVKHDKKENVVRVDYKDIELFKCVANHKDFATLVQNVISYRENKQLSSTISSLEEKQMKEFKLSEKDQETLDITRRKLELSNKMLESLEIPVTYKNKHITEYPQQVLLLANWYNDIIPNFPVEKIETLVSIITNEIVETGKTDISEEVVKDVATLLKEFYAPIYNTTKDSIFKKWLLKFDLKSIRQLLLDSGIEKVVKNGRFTYQTKDANKIRENVAHALLRRMQKDNAEIDTRTKKEKATTEPTPVGTVETKKEK